MLKIGQANSFENQTQNVVCQLKTNHETNHETKHNRIQESTNKDFSDLYCPSLYQKGTSFYHSLQFCFLNKFLSKELSQKFFKKIQNYGLLALLILIPKLSEATFSATTNGTIKGTQPYTKYLNFDNSGYYGDLKVTTKEQALGAYIRDGTMVNGNKNMVHHLWQEGVTPGVINVPKDMLFRDVITLPTPKVLANAAVFDEEGDTATNGYFTGSMTAKWLDPLGEEIIGDALNGKITKNPCLSDKENIYKLIITITDLKGETTYGDPSVTDIGTGKATYLFRVYADIVGNSRICYLQPANMQIYSSGTLHAGRYNPDKWHSERGFTRYSGFPTTGFEKAEFSIHGDGTSQNDYRCTTNDEARIKLSGGGNANLGQNCLVTYKSTTMAQFVVNNKGPTINLETKNSEGNWVVVDKFTIPKPKLWAVFPSGPKTYGNANTLTGSTEFPALDACRDILEPLEPGTTFVKTTNKQATGQTKDDQRFRCKYMYKRTELTNSRAALMTEENWGTTGSAGVQGGYFSRDT